MITTDMIRPFWTDKPELQDVTVLICQNKTPDLIRLSLESLLTFYPTIPVLIVNGTIDDEAGKWCKYQASKHPNVRVWDRVGYDAHGVAMHEAIIDHITTPFILMMDSDVIVKRGGWIEQLKDEIINHNLFACGALMEVSNSGDACGWPKDENDILRYIHPSTGMINRDVYLMMLQNSKGKCKMTDHGAPCVYTYKRAVIDGYEVQGFPIADYVMHLSGASWTEPRTVWSQDNNVLIRPLVTFISDTYIYQVDTDYDILRRGNHEKGQYVIHGREPKEIDNFLFTQRLRITGDYVCPVELGKFIPSDLVSRLRDAATIDYADVITIDNLKFYKRSYYQSEISWL